jgi:DNA helicase HerA-like ATPase
MKKKQRKVILIFGKTGTGKSFFAKKLLSKANRAIVFDPRFEYDGLIVSTFPVFLDVMEQIQNDKKFRVVCRFTNEIHTEMALEVCAHYLSNYVLFLEEAEVYFDARSNNENIKHMVSYGRHKQISLVGITQRAPQINIRFRAQYTSLISFAQSEPSDLDGLDKYGFSQEEIANLPFHEYKVLGESFDEINFA